MKQEIICPTCADGLSRTFGLKWDNAPVAESAPYPGEHVKMVKGSALRDFICDGCGKPLSTGAHCFAMSIWADFGGIPIYEWEQEYIKKEG